MQRSNIARHCFTSLYLVQSTTGVVTQCDTRIRVGIEFDEHDKTLCEIINRSFMNKEKNNRVMGKVTVSYTVPKSLKLELDHLACDQGITHATVIRKILIKEVKVERVNDPKYFTFEDLMNRHQVTRPAI